METVSRVQSRKSTEETSEADVVHGNRGLVLVRRCVLRGSEAILAYMKSSKYLSSLTSAGKQDLFESDKQPLPIRVHLVFWAGFVAPNKYFPVRMNNLPSRPSPPGVSKRVCLMVPDKEGKTPEEVSAFYKTIAKAVDDTHEYEAFTWKQVKKMLETFEDRRNLVKSYDVFLADVSLSSQVLQKCGVLFRRANKSPLVLNLSNATEVKNHLSGTHFFVHANGLHYSYLIGHTLMSAEELCENVIESLNQACKKFENGWRSVREVGLMGLRTSLIPVYDCTDKASLDILSAVYNSCSTAFKKQLVFDNTADDEKANEFIQKSSKANLALKPIKDNLVVIKEPKKPLAKISELKQKLLEFQEMKKINEMEKVKEASGKKKKIDVEGLEGGSSPPTKKKKKTTISQQSDEVCQSNMTKKKQVLDSKQCSPVMSKTKKRKRAPKSDLGSENVKEETLQKEETNVSNEKNDDNSSMRDEIQSKTPHSKKKKAQTDENKEPETFSGQTLVDKVGQAGMVIVEGKASLVRSTTDVAMKKKEKRKLKRALADSSENNVQLSGREKQMFQGTPNKRVKTGIVSPKLTGLEKHILTDSEGKQEKKKKKKKQKNNVVSGESLTGLEKFIFSGKPEKKRTESDHSDVEMPENFFPDTGEDNVNIEKTPLQKPRNSVMSVTTPVRRSRRIHSSAA